MKCLRCGKNYESWEHKDSNDLLQSVFCPDCIDEVKADLSRGVSPSDIMQAKFDDSRLVTPPEFNRYERQIDLDMPYGTDYKPVPSISREDMQKKIVSFTFWVLIISSVAAFTYSLASRFLNMDLPSFPFYPYLIFHAIFLFGIPLRINFAALMVVLINFGFATFRSTFFSHFGNTTWMIIATVMFIISGHAEINNLMVNLMQRKVPMWFLLSFALYFGIVSPFYLGTIDLGRFGKPTEVDSYKVDKVYQENVITADKADREISRRHFVDGKKHAARGNRIGLLRSIQFYEQALELNKGFSTSLAEVAYSYASIGRILKDNDGNSEAIQDYFDKAQTAIGQAKNLSSDNPTIYAVEAILELYSSGREKTLSSLDTAKSLAQEVGYTDRVLQAMAAIEGSKKEKAEYLLAVEEKISSDSPEILNLLGLAYYRLGNKGKAKEKIERAILLNPEYGEAKVNLALVNPGKKEIYEDAARIDSDFSHITVYYSKLLSMQNWLKRLYLILVILFPILVLIASRSKTVFLVYFLGSVLVFLCTYGIFEWYIHVHRPVETISHMFPVSFPFF